MRILLPLLFTLLFIGVKIQPAFGQAPAVSLPGDQHYCGARLVSFSTADANHTPTYSGANLSYDWYLNGAITATGKNPSITIPVGINVITVTVTNNAGATASASQNITVEALPSAPSVANGGMCINSAGTLWVNDPKPNLIYRWYNAGGTFLAFGTSYSTTVAGTYQVDAVTQLGCASSQRTQATLTASSPIGNAEVIDINGSYSKEICSGTSPGTITGNAPQSTNVTHQWFLSTNGSDFYPITAEADKNLTPPALSQTTWYKRISYNGFCGKESNTVKIIVTPVPAAPEVNPALFCLGSQATLTVSNASTSAVYNWYATATSTTIIGSGPTFTTPLNLPAGSRYYYVSASTPSNSVCNTTTSRTAVQVTVLDAIGSNTISASQTLCTGGVPASLTGSMPTGGGGGYIYQWQQSDNGSAFTDIAGANGQDFAPGMLTTTTWYRRKVRTASACPEITSNTVQITVAPLPASIVIADQATCLGSGTTISITDPDPTYTYRWYNVASGGIALATGSSFPTGPLNTNTTFYVEAITPAGCMTARRPVAVKVTPVPTMPEAAGPTICAGSSATLTVNLADAALYYQWYDSNGMFLGIGTSYPTAPLSASTTFYVEAVTYASPNCVSPRKAIPVTVTPLITNNIITASQELCRGGTPATLTGSTPAGGIVPYTYQWQSSTDGAFFQDIAGATGINYAPGALTATTWYRRRAAAAGPCPPVASNVVKIEVYQLPPAPVVANQTICSGAPATLQITAPDANLIYKWYTVAAGGSPIASNVSQYTTEALTSGRTYYVSAETAFGCTSATRQAVTVTVEALPATPAADDATICAGSRATLAVLSPDAALHYQWYDAAQGGTFLATGNTFQTPVLTGSKTFYLEARNDLECASAVRQAITVTVIPIPEIPQVPGASICSGGSTTLYVSNPDASLQYRWYSSSSLLATGTSFPTGTLTANTTYYVEAVTDNATACTSSGRRTVIVSVIPPIINNTISASQTICSGSSPAALTGTTPSGGSGTLTYQWEKSEDGLNFTVLAGATSAALSPGALTASTWYRRRVKGADSCPDHVSAAVQITVNALPATPSADNITVCSGSTATLTVNTPAAGTTYKWYTAATGGSILSSQATLLTGNLFATTTFYVEATIASSGCVSARRPVTVTVRELPEMPLAANQSICLGQNTTLSVSSPNASLSYKWYNASGALVGTGNSLPVNGLIASATFYLEAVYNTLPACASPRREVTVAVTPLPNLPAVSDITICSGTKGVLQVQGADPGLTYHWYATETGGSPMHTEPTFVTPVALTSARTYYVEALAASGCSSGRKAVTVNVSPLPASPMAANVEICAGERATLTVSGADGTLIYQWYASNTDTQPLASGTSTTFQTAALQATTTFYLEAMTAAGCVSASRQAVQVTVTPRPAEPVAADKTTCAGGSVVLAVQNPSAAFLYKWYDEAETYLATGIYYNTGTLQENKVYYLEAVTNNSTACTSSIRRTVTVTVTPEITNNTISASQTICSGATPVMLNGAIPDGGGTSYAYQWLQSTDGTNFTNITGATSQAYTPGSLAVTTWFRRRVTATGPCAPSLSTPVQITVVDPPTAPAADNQTICAGTVATLSIKDPTAGYTYYWYNTGTGGNVLDISESFTTPELNAAATYYVAAVNGTGCIGPRRAVTVNVTAQPAIPQAADRVICEGQTVTLAVSPVVQNLVYSWYDDTNTLVGTGPSFTTPDPLFASTFYYVEAATVTSPRCISGRKTVTVSVSAVPTLPVTADVTICAGGTAVLTVQTADPALTYKWYTTAAGGTAVASGTSFVTGTLTSNKTYYVEAVSASGCTSARAAVAVSVTPLPATPAAAPVAVCAGSTATLAVTSPDANLVYNWYDAGTDGNLLATGETYTVAGLTASATYYLEAATASGCVSTSRRAVTVSVTPLPEAPEVSNAMICAAGTATLWVSNQAAGLTYKWYDNTGGYLATGPSYTTQSLNASTTYQVEAVSSSATGCVSATRSEVVVTVTPAIANNLISTAQTICSGTIPAQLSGLTPNGGGGSYSYQWERSEDGTNFMAIAAATNADYTPAALYTNTWFRRKVKAAGPCPEGISAAVLITVNPLPATPLAANATVCAGSTATLLVSDADADLSYRWYNAAVGGSILHTDVAFTTNALEATATFYLEAVNATGCVSSRRAVTVTVTPLPEAPAVAGKTICAGGQATLTVSAQTTGLVYRWYNGAGELLASGPSFTTGPLSGTTVYYAEAATAATPSCVSARSSVTVNVTPLPATPLADDVTVCAGSPAELVVSNIDANLQYKWYSTATASTPVHTGSTYRTPALTSAATYFVAAETAAGCTSASRRAVTVSVTQVPAMPVAAGQTICAGPGTTLTVTTPDATLSYSWYNAGGTLLAEGNTFATGNLSATTTFYVKATSRVTAGCSSASRAVTVTVTPLPAEAEVADVTICAGATATLEVSNAAPSVSYNWYDQSETLLATGTSFTTPTLSSGTTYYVEAVTSNGCISATRQAVTVTVTPAISNNNISDDQTICYGSAAADITGLSPIGGGGGYSYQWESSADGINFSTITGATAASYAPGALTADTWLRRIVKAAGPCSASISNTIQLTVTPLPAAPLAQSSPICAGATATLSVLNASSSLTYRWYSAATGGTVLRTGVTYPVELQATTTFYVEALSGGGCISPRRSVTVVVTPVPAAPLAESKTICTGSQAVLAVSSPDPALVYRWYNSADALVATGTSYTTTALSASATYYVEAATAQAPVCVSSRSTVTVTVTPLPAMPVVNSATVCSGTSASLAVAVIDPALTYKWYTTAAGGTAVAGSNTFNTGVLTSNRTYYVEAVTTSGCTSARAAVAVSVTPLPATPAAAPVAVCAGSTATLAVTSPDASLVYNWYDAGTDGNLLATGETYTVAGLTASATYYLEAATASGCASTSRRAVTVSVTPLPEAPEADNVTICTGSSTTLWVKNQEPNLVYNWYSGGTLVGTGVSYTTGSLSAGTTYEVEAVTNTGAACSSSTRSEVLVTVTPAISNNFISASQTICSGSMPANLTGSLPTGGGGSYSYQWESSADGINFSTITGATSAAYAPGVLTANTWLRRIVKAASPCSASTSNTVQLTVTPLPAAPVAQSSPICAGATATLSVLNASSSLTYRWYSTATGGTVLRTGDIYPVELQATTTFYVEALSGGGCISPRRAVTVVVTPVPAAPLTESKTICTGSPAVLSVSSPDPALVYRWYNSANALVATGTSYTTTALSASATYYVEAATAQAPVCVSSRSTVTVTVTPLPAMPVVNSVTVCSGTSAGLTVTVIDPALTYKWYTTAAGGTAVASGTSFVTGTLTSNRTYYVEAVSASGCTSARAAVAVSVTPLPATPAAAPVAVCAGSTATLAVTSPDANLVYNWYDAGTDGNLLATGETYTVAGLTASATYYLEAATASGCVSTSRRAVTVTVTPLPEAPEVSNAMICAAGTATLWVSNQAAGLTYKWYDNTGGYLATGPSYTTQSLNASTTYQVEAVSSSATGCVSATRSEVSVTVTPAIANNLISTAQTICSGTTPAILTGSLPNGGGGSYSYQWERSEDGTNFMAIAAATNADYTPAALYTNTWFRRKVKAAGPCPESTSAAVLITVNPLPATPLAANATVCAGSTATLSVSDADPDLSYRWYNAAVGGSILHTDVAFTTNALEATATFYLEAVNATGCVSPRRAVTVTVTPLPEAPAVAGKTICAGGQATLTVSAQTTGLVYRWYNGAGELLASGPSFTTGPLTSTTVYYAEAATAATPSCVSARSSVTVNVTPLPATPLADDVTVCAGSPAELVVSNIDANLQYKWYSTATASTPVHTGSTYRTPALTSAATYFVAAETAAGCTSASRRAVTVSVTQVPAMPVAAGQTICAGPGTTLTVTTPDATLSYSWYNAGGTLLAEGNTFATGNLSATTTFYVKATSRVTAGCSSASRAVTVTVTPLPAEAEVADVTICAGATATLEVSNAAPSVSYNWYNQSETLLATGTSFTTPALSAGTTYYVEAVTSNGCISATRQAVTVTVTPAIANNLISTSQTICSGSTPATLAGSLPTGGGGGYSYQWESSADGINFSTITGATAAAYAPGALTADTWLRRIVKAAGPCSASTSNTVQLTVTPLPAAPVAQSSPICAGATATLSVLNASSSLTYRWYSTATGGTVLRTGVTYPVELQATTTFYVEALTNGGCISPRRAVTVAVTPVPAVPLAESRTICTGGQAVLSVSSPDPALVYRWYNSADALVATGTSYTTTALNASATYYVEAATAQAPVCASSRSTVTVTVTPLPAMPVVNSATVCSGSSAALAVAVIDPALTYKWYTTAAGGTAVAESNTFNTGVLTSNRTYYVEAVTASGCTSARAAVAVSVTPLPATPAAAPVAVCAGSTATLAVTSPDAGLVYNWYDAGTDGNLLATGETYTVAGLTASATYYLEAATASGCASTSRRAVTVNVTPLPEAPEADNVTICTGSSTTLWVKNQEPNLVYNWYSGGALVGTGVSYTTGSLSAATTYEVEAVTNTGAACSSSTRSEVVVTVTPAIANNFISASQTICSGTTPATLTGSLPNGGGGSYSYQWERSEDGINFMAIATATNADYTPEVLNNTTWYRRKVKALGPCGESISAAVQITITAIPASPVADNAAICAGATATLSIKNINTAYTYRWYLAPTGGSALPASTSFTTPALESSTTYYVEAVNGAGCISPRKAVTVSVMPLPDAPLAADQTICAGEQATLTVSNQAAGLNYNWYSSNHTLLATSSTYTTGALSNNTLYYVEAATTATPSCVSGLTAVMVNVVDRPAIPLADDITICAGSTASLAVKGIIPGQTYKWYTVASGGLPVHTGSGYTTAALTSGRTYYLEALTASGCSSASRKPVVVNVIQPPATPVVADRTICYGQAVTLLVTNPDANLTYRWYNQDGTALATGNTYTTGALSAGATFYVAALTNTSPVCTSSQDAVIVTVTPLPAMPEVEAVTVCAGATATLTVSNAAPSVTYNWYSGNGELQGTGISYTTPALMAGATYQVEAVTANGCISPGRQAVAVQVVQPIRDNVIGAGQTICYGLAPAMLTGSQPNGGNGSFVFQWESSEDGINFRNIAAANGKDYTSGNLTVTTWFRRKASAGGTCPPHISTAVKITVLPLPALAIAGDVMVCAGANATLRIAGADANLTYRWYEVATGGSTLATGDSFVATAVTTTTTYFVEAVNASGCTGTRRAVTIFVTPVPDLVDAGDKTICTGESATLSVTAPGARLVYNWYDSNGVLQRTGTYFTTPVLDRTTVYYVEAVTATAQACKGPRRAVTVSVTPKPPTPVVDPVSICAGSTANLTVKNYDASLTYRWYSTATGGTPLANGLTYTTTNLTSSRTYYAAASTDGGCTGDRVAVRVSVTPLPALPVVAGKAICAGQTATLAIQGAAAELNYYRWYDASVGGTLLATGSSFTTGTLSQSRTYYVEAESPSGCISSSRRAVVVNVAPLPAAPAVEDATVCAGEKVTLSVKNPDPALTYKWYGDAAATELVGSGISYTPADAVVAARSYYVEAVNASGCTSAAPEEVTVLVMGKPDAPVVDDATVCAGGSATLAVVGPDAALVYSWQDARGTLLHTGTTYITAPVSSEATFYVTAYTTTRPACASARLAVTVRVMATVTGNTISDDQSICSGEVPAKLSGSFPTAGGGMAYQWERSEDGVNYVSIVGANAQEYAPANLTTDTWFRRKVSVAGPCPESVSNVVRIRVASLPATPAADAATVCAGSQAFLRVKFPASGISNITYRWYLTATGGTPVGSGTYYRTPDLTASTTYYLEALNGNGCRSARQAVPVTVNQAVANNTISTSQTICTGSRPTELSGAIPDGGNGVFSYQWESSSNGVRYMDIAGATGQNYTPAAGLTQSTWYRRRVLANGPCPEHISNAVKIEVVPQPLAPTVSQAAICPGSRATLEAMAMSGLRVEWYDAPHGGYLLGTGSTFETPVLATTTSFWAQTINSNNCESAVRQEAKVLVVAPQVTISQDLTIEEGKPVQLIAGGGASYAWYPQTGLSDPAAANPVARPQETTTYTVTINTKEGCSVVRQVTITVLSRIIAANVLTPNGDGFNDNFEIKNIEHYPDCQVEIYTRWGEKVFESKGYKEAWNGTKNGNALPVAAYYYIIRLNKNDKPISGSVTIVK